MPEPLLSILCITYNHAPYIRQCLDGFIMQKVNFPIEVLINDDASTDGTADIIREYEQKYPDIIKPLYQTENQFSKGIPVNWIYNYPRIKGKYFTTCEGDDYWIDDCYLKDGVMFLEQHKEYNCYAANTICKKPNSEEPIVNALDYNNIGHDVSFDNYLYLHTSARMYRNIIDLTASFDPLPCLADSYLWYIYLDKGKVFFEHKIVSVYRITGKGIWTNLTKKEQINQNYEANILANKYFSNKYSVFFWRAIPKNIILRAIKKIIGIERTMELLFFFLSKFGKNH